MKRYLLVSVPLLGLMLAACSSDGVATGPSSLTLTADDTLQAAVLSASDASAEDVDVLLASDMTMGGGLSPSVAPAGPSFASSGDSPRVGFWSFGSGCTFDATSGRFTCPPVTNGGLTLTRSVAFFDASGKPMSAYNDTLTASADFQVAVSGVRAVSNGADTVSRQRDMSVAGLLGHETSRTWNGTGTRIDGGYHVDSSKTRTYHTTDNSTFSNIVVHLPRSANPFPLSGTITRQISGTASVVKGGVTKTFSVSKTVTVTFNGTRYVPMTVGTTAYTLDLETGKATKA